MIRQEKGELSTENEAGRGAERERGISTKNIGTFVGSFYKKPAEGVSAVCILKKEFGF